MPGDVMLYLRSFLYLVGQVSSAVVICLAAIPTLLLPITVRNRVITQWARFNIWTLRHLCGITYRVEGQENIPDEPSVIVSNHQSAWETLGFQMIFPTQSYLLKKILLWIPIFGIGLAMMRPIAIDRSRKLKSMNTLVREGIIRLNEGRFLVIFPEGTRQPPGKPGKFQPGGAMIASRSGASIVPVVHNSGVFWPKRSFLKYPGTITVMIGPPITPDGKKVRDMNAEAESWIVENLVRLPGSRD